MNQVLEALNDFEIVEKPKYVGRTTGKNEKLYTALKNLSSERSIKFPISVLEGKKLNYWRNSLQTTGKKRGLKIGAIEKEGFIYVFNK